MGFRKGAFAKVWEVEVKSNLCTKLQISISHKDKTSGDYVQDFSGFVSCCGEVAAKAAAALKQGDMIKLGEVDVTTNYDKEKHITYTNYKAFSLEANPTFGSSAPQKKDKADGGNNEPANPAEDKELPY